MTKEEILENLQSNILTIYFKFCDKKIRNYKITLNTDIIPKEAFLTVGPKIQELATVWDVENKRWIAFSWEKIHKVEADGTVQ